ncbi:S1C family serine protease [Actinacidiphila oryziradicis]|uniref:PDZ domain-containing protein n=1 Tax=Actinacidiphila oryziradicis TaxID=2571141 RepID=A0A4U0SQT4_9ACTN|nr:trypsin-like peptidase domain-containing protein [Actinacidiphila oryziradicis]TKA10621.1 PDZ domain-containing protein [Actinacidiphila oryziradicis]
MDVGKSARPNWWSRPEPAPEAGTRYGVVMDALPAGQAPGTAAAPAEAQPVPMHAADPYDTPPYGSPGPWAPAPPVLHPGTPGPGEQSLWQADSGPPPLSVGLWHPYDPWAQPGGPAGPVGPSQRPRGRGRGLVGLLAVVLVAGGVGGATGAYLSGRDGTGGAAGSVSLPQASLEPGGRAPDSIAAIAARTLPGVVYIHVKGADGEDTGTGFVLDGQGHILTNNHVVEAAAKSGSISVTFNGGQVAAAKVTGRDTGYDLAVVKVSGVSGLRPLTLGDSAAVRVGDPVVAIGAPYGLEGTVTSGIISATERPITAGGQSDGTDMSYVDALQTDAPINPGNSGGPLVDAKGQVIGINSAIRSADSASDPFGGTSQGGSIGLGFAIPVNQAKRVAEELIATGKATHPVIGVGINMQYSGDGAQVSSEVTAGGPGDRAGIKPGDIITAIDGTPVHSGDELIVRIRSHRPGDRLALTLLRGGRPRTVSLTLGSATGG